mgnify:CR=1 FL=1
MLIDFLKCLKFCEKYERLLWPNVGRERRNTQGERVLLRYDQLPNENYFENKMQCIRRTQKKNSFEHIQVTNVVFIVQNCYYCTRTLDADMFLNGDRPTEDNDMLVEVLWKSLNSLVIFVCWWWCRIFHFFNCTAY